MPAESNAHLRLVNPTDRFAALRIGIADRALMLMYRELIGDNNGNFWDEECEKWVFMCLRIVKGYLWDLEDKTGIFVCFRILKT